LLLDILKTKNSQCLFNCAAKGHFLAALEWKSCFCFSDEIPKSIFDAVDPGECFFPCKDDPTKERCGGDGRISVFRTNLEDTRCTNVTLGENGQFKKIMLASLPGSGNTWTRYLIERATGFYTGTYLIKTVFML
jgi:hypothetical protein